MISLGGGVAPPIRAWPHTPWARSESFCLWPFLQDTFLIPKAWPSRVSPDCDPQETPVWTGQGHGGLPCTQGRPPRTGMRGPKALGLGRGVRCVFLWVLLPQAPPPRAEEASGRKAGPGGPWPTVSFCLPPSACKRPPCVCLIFYLFAVGGCLRSLATARGEVPSILAAQGHGSPECRTGEPTAGVGSESPVPRHPPRQSSPGTGTQTPSVCSLHGPWLWLGGTWVSPAAFSSDAWPSWAKILSVGLRAAAAGSKAWVMAETPWRRGHACRGGGRRAGRRGRAVGRAERWWVRTGSSSMNRPSEMWNRTGAGEEVRPFPGGCGRGVSVSGRRPEHSGGSGLRSLARCLGHVVSWLLAPPTRSHVEVCSQSTGSGAPVPGRLAQRSGPRRDSETHP